MLMAIVISEWAVLPTLIHIAVLCTYTVLYILHPLQWLMQPGSCSLSISYGILNPTVSYSLFAFKISICVGWRLC